MPLDTLKRGLTLPELLDYKESLEVMQLLSDAAQKDAEREAKANSGK